VQALPNGINLNERPNFGSAADQVFTRSFLRKIKGQVGHDGVEPISTEAIFEKLDIRHSNARLKRPRY
jgi:hypothetical protein